MDFTFFLLAAAAALFIPFFLWVAKELWLDWRQGKYVATLEYTLLAIDIPKENLQSPKAVENMFDQISGAHSSFGFWDKWWEGKVQAKFSFEIISIDGYVQFLIYTEKRFRDLVEAAVYAQYPDAEITEVEDYTPLAPQEFPNEKYNLWGSEFILSNSDAYPIRTYPFFEHNLSQDFKDPMIALLETMSSLKKGENVWIQYVVTMTGFEWRSKIQAEIAKITGRGGKKGGFFADLTAHLGAFVNDLIAQIGHGAPSEPKKEEKKDDPLMFKLTPGELEKLKALENKMGKTGFQVKMRMIYFAPRSIYSTSRAVSSTVGAIKQFAGPYNALKPEAKFTRTKKFLIRHEPRLARRQRKIVTAYTKRSNSMGAGKGFILCSEELATLYHLPLNVSLHAPTLNKVEIKKAKPPVNLPTEPEPAEEGDGQLNSEEGAVSENFSRQEPPLNLPN